MTAKEKIDVLKQEFAKKYEKDRMEEILDDGYFEREYSIPKSELTELARQQMEKMKEIYYQVIGLMNRNNYDIVYNEYLKEKEIHEIEENEEIQYHVSQNTKDFLDTFHNPYEDIVDFLDIITATYQRYNASYNGLAKGDNGEEYVEKELEIFKGKYKYVKNIKLVNVDFKGKTSETDLYIATSKGILVCEIKNKGNEKYLFKISKDGQWTKYDSRGNFLEVLDSPFAQNTRHCIATEQLLKQNGISDYRIIPVVIIANEKVRIENNSNNAVIRISELYNYVENLKYPEKYSEEYQNEIISLFEKNNVEEENNFKAYIVDEKMYQRSMDYIKYLLQMIQDMEILKTKISDLEKQMLDEAAKKIKQKCIKPIIIGVIVELGLILATIITCFFIIGAIAVIFGIFLYFYITNDYFINIEDEKINMAIKIFEKGEY